MIGHANQLKKKLRERNIPLIINDRVDVAILVCLFEFSHLVRCGRSSYRTVRHGCRIMSSSARTLQNPRRLRPNAFSGPESAAGRRGLPRLRRRLPHHVSLGRAFHRRSKDDADAVGLDGLRRVCEAVEIPVVSIGGVTAGNAGLTLREGAVGVAVISAIFGRKDVKEAAKELRNAVEKALE